MKYRAYGSFSDFELKPSTGLHLSLYLVRFQVHVKGVKQTLRD